MATVLVGVISWVGAIGFVIIVIAAIVWLIFSYNLWRTKKKFANSSKPEINKIKKEVEDERRLRDTRRNQAKQKYQGAGESSSVPDAEPYNRRELLSVDFS